MSNAPYPLSKCNSVTRRRFLAGLGASVAVATAGAYGISVWGRNPNGTGIPEVAAGSIPSGAPVPAGAVSSIDNRTLVVIEMGGGNDGLNTVVPHNEPLYHDLRGDLAVATPLDLDGEVGLHPALEFLAEAYSRGDVAVVEGVGYPDPDLSHFASMATWWSAGGGGTGWLGRYLDATVGDTDPLAGVAIGPGPTPALLGDSAFQISIQDMGGLSPRIPEWIDNREELVGMWQGFAPAQFDGSNTLDLVRRAIAVTADAQATVNDVLGSRGISSPTIGRTRQRGDLEQYIDVAAALMTSPLAPRVIYLHGWGDFDTHEGQDARHTDMMQQLDNGLSKLMDAAESAGVGERVTIMTTSEFGRRPSSNGSGTDHGTASSHFIVGSAVSGGRYGQPPSLSSLDTRDNLIHTIDYRSVYATLLDGWLGAESDLLLGGEFERLPIFA